MGRLVGRIALITGGRSGIGLATAKRSVEEGAYVFITGGREAELNAAVKDVGKNIKALKGDVSHLGDLDRILSVIKQDKGRLDIVFANAGVPKYAALGEITEEFYECNSSSKSVSRSEDGRSGIARAPGPPLIKPDVQSSCLPSRATKSARWLCARTESKRGVDHEGCRINCPSDGRQPGPRPRLC